jgi:carboxyl-terminal processing protease
LEQNPIYGLLIDLRSNGGGYIDEGICLVDLFLHEGVITNLIDGKGEKQETHVAQESVYHDTELVILIDSDTASAAELFSGVLQHYKRAQLVGESTYGKSSMQKVYQLDNKSVLKLTVARYSIGDKILIDEQNPIVPDHNIHTVHPKVQRITKELSEHLEGRTLKKVQRSLESLYPVARGNIQKISWTDDLKKDLHLEKGWKLLKKE